MQQLHDRWLGQPRWDWLVLLIPAVIAILWQPCHPAPELSKAVSTTVGVLFGMTGIIWTTYQSGVGRRMSILRQQWGDDIRSNWLSCLLGLVLATFVALAAVAVPNGAVAWWLTLSAGTLALVKAVRVGILVNLLATISDRDAVPQSEVREDIDIR